MADHATEISEKRVPGSWRGPHGGMRPYIFKKKKLYKDQEGQGKISPA
jgi:hypothetical protein